MIQRDFVWKENNINAPGRLVKTNGQKFDKWQKEKWWEAVGVIMNNETIYSSVVWCGKEGEEQNKIHMENSDEF